jgi:hypothetical protein
VCQELGAVGERLLKSTVVGVYIVNVVEEELRRDLIFLKGREYRYHIRSHKKAGRHGSIQCIWHLVVVIVVI